MYKKEDVHTELIDTLWNVNAQPIKTTAGAASELIDTLWNVNLKLDTSGIVSVVRINRYIMECK